MTTRLDLTRLLALPLVWVIRIYQIVVSPLLTQQCRFYPSCSAYAVTALTRFGIVAGSWLAVRRLARCHPWNPGGVDHVPPRPVPRAPLETGRLGRALLEAERNGGAVEQNGRTPLAAKQPSWEPDTRRSDFPSRTDATRHGRHAQG